MLNIRELEPAARRALTLLRPLHESFSFFRLDEDQQFQLQRGWARLKSVPGKANRLRGPSMGEAPIQATWLALPTAGPMKRVGSMVEQSIAKGIDGRSFEHVLSGFDFLLGLTDEEIQQLENDAPVALQIKTLRSIPGDWAEDAPSENYEAHCARFHTIAVLEMDSVRGMRLLPGMGPSAYRCIQNLTENHVISRDADDVLVAIDSDGDARRFVDDEPVDETVADVFLMTRRGVWMQFGRKASFEEWIDQ